jgi:hypothetical protein
VTSVGIVRRAGAWSGTRTSRLPLAQLSHSVIPNEVFGSDSLTTEPSLAIEPAAEEENPSGQRRYFVKRGLFYDPADKVAQSRSAGAVEEIPDKRPLDLKMLFPKLSLR